jgi:hypothetical protein
MQTREVTTFELRRAFRATVQVVGGDSDSASMLRAELERRGVFAPQGPRPRDEHGRDPNGRLSSPTRPSTQRDGIRAGLSIRRQPPRQGVGR